MQSGIGVPFFPDLARFCLRRVGLAASFAPTRWAAGRVCFCICMVDGVSASFWHGVPILRDFDR